jgi:hypothetical protein
MSIIGEKIMKQERVFTALLALMNYSLVTVTRQVQSNGLTKIITISHVREYVPDFELEYCSVGNVYRVYILVGNRGIGKKRAGYCICTLSTELSVFEFINMYGTLIRYRANNKET